MACKRCPNCGSITVIGTDNFCSRCGVALEPYPHPKCSCGEEYMEWQKYCTKCGKEVKKQP